MTTITQIEDSVFDFVAAVLPDRLAFLENQDGVLRPKITIDEGRPYVAYKIGLSDTFAHAPSRLQEVTQNIVIFDDQSQNTDLGGSARQAFVRWTPDRDYQVNELGFYLAVSPGQPMPNFWIIRVRNRDDNSVLWSGSSIDRVNVTDTEPAFVYEEFGETLTFSEGTEYQFELVFQSVVVFHGAGGIHTASFAICEFCGDPPVEAINQRSLIRVDLDLWRGEAVADGVRLQAACNAEIGLRTIFQHTGRSAVSPVQDLAEVVQGKIAPRAMMTISAYANLEYQFAASYFDKIQVNDKMIEQVSVSTESD